MSDSSSIACETQKIKSFSDSALLHFINLYLSKKYYNDKTIYDTIMINSIIFSEKRIIENLFREYLVTNEETEFLNRYYKNNESLARLPKYLDYYFYYSTLFPLYTALPKSQYLFKNIHKKQIVIDYQQKKEEAEEIKKKKEERKKKRYCSQSKNE